MEVLRRAISCRERARELAVARREELISATVIPTRARALGRRAIRVASQFSDAYEDEPGLHQGAAALHGAAAGYEAREDREDWLRYRLGAVGVYVARPKNDGGWYKSPTVKAGSMFANPFVVGDGKDKYTVSESLDHFRRYIEARAAPDATTDRVIALLPPQTRRLAERRQRTRLEGERGPQRRAPGLEPPARVSRCRASAQRKRLGCFCAETDPCHAKALLEFAEAFSAVSGRKRGLEEVARALSRRRLTRPLKYHDFICFLRFNSEDLTAERAIRRRPAARTPTQSTSGCRRRSHCTRRGGARQ